MSHTLKELLLCLACPTTLLGLSGNESEFDLVVQRGGARDDVPYPDICCTPARLFIPNPEPRRDPEFAAAAKFEQNEMFDFLREL